MWKNAAVLLARKEPAMDWAALFDVQSATLVAGGTLGATLLRSGWREARACADALRRLLEGPFRYDAARAEIAHEVELARRDGIIRAVPPPSSDADLADAIRALVHHRSVAALLAAHAHSRALREDRRRRGTAVIEQASELAPVFGLAGTLLALSQLAPAGLQQGAMMQTVATAVLTTLYGLLLAHVVLLPLARIVERRGEMEEVERQRLVNWLAGQIAGAVPDAGGGPANPTCRSIRAEAA